MQDTGSKVPFNFHDAVIIRCSINENDWTLQLRLYEIFYPGKKEVILVFKDIHSIEKVLQLHQMLVADELEPGWNGTRINKFDLDTKKVSSETNQYFYLDADGYQPITIGCAALEILVL